MNPYCCEKPDCRDTYCPGRPSKVAKVGQRYPKHSQPVFVPYMQRQLKALAKWMLLAILGWVIWAPLLYLLLRE